jgi:hypothetical protein
VEAALEVASARDGDAEAHPLYGKTVAFMITESLDFFGAAAAACGLQPRGAAGGADEGGGDFVGDGE